MSGGYDDGMHTGTSGYVLRLHVPEYCVQAVVHFSLFITIPDLITAGCSNSASYRVLGIVGECTNWPFCFQLQATAESWY